MTASSPLVSRTFRAAIRLGEDFITVEETVALPLDAGDDDIARAVQLGQRIYEAQRAAVEAQVAAFRPTGSAAPAGASYTPAPRLATPKQRDYLTSLQEKAGWSSEDLARQIAEWGGDSVDLTADLASRLIDLLRSRPAPPSALVNGRPPMLAALDEPPPPAGPSPNDGHIEF